MIAQNEKIFIDPEKVCLIKSFEEKDDQTAEITYYIGYMLDSGNYYIRQYSDQTTRDKAFEYWTSSYTLKQI